MILQDDEAHYDGDPFARHQSRLREERSGATSAFFVIDSGSLRAVPDAETLRHMHLAPEHASPLSHEERRNYAHGAPFPSRRDGQFLKMHKRTSIFLMRNGTRHEVSLQPALTPFPDERVFVFAYADPRPQDLLRPRRRPQCSQRSG